MKAAEGGVWISIKIVVLALTGLSQTIIMSAAAYFIEDTSVRRVAEIDAMKDDQAVLEEDKKVEERVRSLNKAVEYSSLTVPHKIMLWTAVISMSAACYMWSFLSSYCFVPFDVTDTIGERLNNNVLNIVVWPGGYISLSLFFLGCAFLGLHNMIATKRVSENEAGLRTTQNNITDQHEISIVPL